MKIDIRSQGATVVVLYDAPDDERRGGDYTVFGDLLRHD